MAEEPMSPEPGANPEEASTTSRPAFMGTAVPVPDTAARRSTTPRWVPLSIVVVFTPMTSA